MFTRRVAAGEARPEAGVLDSRVANGSNSMMMTVRLRRAESNDRRTLQLAFDGVTGMEIDNLGPIGPEGPAR